MATINIISVNVHSMFHKMHEICHIARAYSPYVIHIQETWLSEAISDSAVSAPGYRSYRIFRNDRTSGFGGVATYIATGLRYSIHIPQQPEGYESIWITLKLPSLDLNVINIYRPPKCNAQDFLDSLERDLANRRNVILSGDFNMDAEHPPRILSDFLDRNGMSLVGCGPTYIRAQTAIDFFVTDAALDVKAVVGPTIGSDHLPIIGQVSLAAGMVKVSKQKSIIVRKRYVQSPEFTASVTECCSSFSSLDIQDVDAGCDSFMTSFADVVTKHFPLCKIQLKHKRLVSLTQGLRRCIANRRRLYRTAFLTQSALLWRHYHTYNRVLNKALKSHNNSVLKEKICSAKDLKSKWRILNAVIKGKKSATPTDVPIGVDIIAAEFKALVEAAIDKSLPSDDSSFLEYLNPD